MLTDKEKEIAKDMAEGLTIAESAKKRNRSPKTINAHREQIKKKLHAKNSVHAVAIAIRQGIIMTLCGVTLAGAISNPASVPRVRGGGTRIVRLRGRGRAREKWCEVCDNHS